MGRKRKAPERQPKGLDSLESPGVRLHLANATVVAHMLGRQTARFGPGCLFARPAVWQAVRMQPQIAR